MELAIAAAGVFGVLVIAEVLWYAKILRDELARKFVHVIVGTFVAFWPYFMSWRQIQIMCLAFLIVVVISKKWSVFNSVHGVKRRTRGEAFFALGIGLSALIAPEPIIFTAAILHLSLADGFAALVGKHYGLRHQYKVRDYTKTLAGTSMFLLTSMVIITGAVLLGGQTVTWPIVPLLIWLPLAATILENLAGGGTDNVLVPLLIIVVLQQSSVF